MEKYTTRELTKEEGEALTKDMQEVLEKHNAEMSVMSVIQLLKRELIQDIPSPFIKDGENNGTTEETEAPGEAK